MRGPLTSAQTRAFRLAGRERWIAAALLAAVIHAPGPLSRAWGDNPPASEAPSTGESVKPAAAPVKPALPAAAPPTLRAGEPAATPAPPEMAAPADQVQMEVVAFLLQGKQPWQRVRISDLDAALTPDKQRLIPLLRVLAALKIDYTQREGQIAFQPAGLAAVEVDAPNRRATVGGKSQSVVLAQAESIITHQPDVYLPPSAIARMLGMSLQWNEQTYEYIGNTDMIYEVWRAGQRQSLLGMLPKQVPEGLPELFPPNRPDDWELDFMELRGRVQAQLAESGTNLPGPSADSLTQSFWGRAMGGRFYTEWSEPSLSWNHRDGFTNTPTTPLLLNWGELIFDTSDSELALGDSTFALSELAVPFARLTGIRYNGQTGITDENVNWGASGRSARQQFFRPRIFEGFARVGSKAELFINDRSVATDEVLTTAPGAAPDEGLWHFKDVTLPAGTTNEIRIVITDPSGFKTQIARTILSAENLVPKGQVAYMSALGTSRNSQSWDSRGVLGGWRALYGLTDHLSVGGFMAAQNSFNVPAAANDPLDPNARPVPTASAHTGVETSWQVLDNLTFFGNFAVSARRDEPGDPSISDSAFYLRDQYWPAKTVSIHSSYFRFGPDYFNGVALRPHDRQGETVGGRWKLLDHWTLASSGGVVENNLNQRLPTTTRLDFETARIQTDWIPRTNAGFEVARIHDGAGGPPQVLYTWNVTTSLPAEMTFDAAVSVGDSLSPPQDFDFFTGLNVPDLPLFSTATTSLALRKAFESGHNVGATYKKNSNLERFSVLDDWRPRTLPRLRIFTELGWDFNDEQIYFDHRDEYFLTPTGSASVGLQLHSERGETSALIVLTINEMFSFHGHEFTRISERSIQPWTGGIQGQVLSNVVGDGRPHEGEKGVPDVRVSNGITTTTTDADGYFILPGDRRLGRDRVYLDPNTIPATEMVSNGVQSVYVGPNSLTLAYLAVTPAHSAKGFVFIVEADKTQKPVAGAKVSLIREEDHANAGESFTAADGSYYLGNIAPGTYSLVVARETLPALIELAENRQTLKVEPNEEMAEYAQPPFLGRRLPSPKKD